MSRIGKQPIDIPQGVKVDLSDKAIKVKGPKGELECVLKDEVTVEVDGSVIRVSRRDDSRQATSLHGLTRSLISNMVKGVSEGFEKRLEIVGVGYKAEAKGSSLNLILGYSHPINYELPKGITASVEKLTSIILKGTDKQLVGQVASEIRDFRPPEPYKGKGIKYADEVIRRKAGKAAKGVGV
jgi:large subunit ribosomal protein L6